MRIAIKSPADTPWYLRPFFWNQRRKYGAALDSALAWARSPRLFVGVATLYGMIDRKTSPIEPALRSLLTVRVSQINHCPFCVDLNSATLIKRGASPHKIQALDRWRDSPLFDERERAALDYAEAVTYPDRGVDDALMARLKRHFDDDAVVELTGLIAFQNLSSKFNSALGIAPQGFCRLPAQGDQRHAARKPTPGEATRSDSRGALDAHPHARSAAGGVPLLAVAGFALAAALAFGWAWAVARSTRAHRTPRKAERT